MMKNRIAGVFFMAAVTALTALPALAAETAAAAPKSVCVSASGSGEGAACVYTEFTLDKEAASKIDLKSDGSGNRYFITDKGEKVYITVTGTGDANGAGTYSITLSGK